MLFAFELDVFERAIPTSARTASGPCAARSSTQRQAHRSDRCCHGRDRGQHECRMRGRNERDVFSQLTRRNRSHASEETACRDGERLLLGNGASVLHGPINNDVVSTDLKSARHSYCRVERSIFVDQGSSKFSRRRMSNDRDR